MTVEVAVHVQHTPSGRQVPQGAAGDARSADQSFVGDGTVRLEQCHRCRAAGSDGEALGGEQVVPGGRGERACADMDGCAQVGGDLPGEGRIDGVGQETHLVEGVATGRVGKEAACLSYDAPLGGFGVGIASLWTAPALPLGRPVSAAPARTAWTSAGP
ncbi:hypothetical protein ACIF83_06990 [Streptomyces sp. NPDC085866]|uniref:hypothetical protein n=1 Tax=Streptomyces sp. NPDC085866 TaxID=3365736 RepID=UPI0037CFE306